MKWPIILCYKITAIHTNTILQWTVTVLTHRKKVFPHREGDQPLQLLSDQIYLL